MRCNVHHCRQRATRRVEALYESPFAFSGPVSGISYMCDGHADKTFENRRVVGGGHRPLFKR